MFVDSHCHINSDDFDNDRLQVVQRAREMKVEYILDVSDDIKKTPEIIEFCAKNHHIYTTSGVHPELLDEYDNLQVEDILQNVSSPFVVGIGECGLDYYYQKKNKDKQIKVLKTHIEAARISQLPLIIHSRDADEDMMEILQTEYKKGNFFGELHCFSSSQELCKQALEIGFYISASGIITFHNAEKLRCIFANVPDERLLTETDSPYLAPIPHRGKRNEPAFVVNTVQCLAEIKHKTVQQMAAITARNFFNLFTKVKADE